MGASAGLAFGLGGGKTKTKVDDTTKALNEFRLRQAQSLVEDYGVSLRALQAVGTPDKLTQKYAYQLGDIARERGLTADNWYESALENSAAAYNSNLNYITDTLAPSLVSAGNSYYNQILRPEIANNASLLGLGRSGAQIEAQAKGAASIALPISQQIAGLVGENRAAKAEAIRGFNQQRPDVDINTRNSYLQRLGLGLNAYDYTRQQRQANQETYSNLLTSFINATPYQAGSTTKFNTWNVQGQVSASTGSGGGGGNAGFFGGGGSDSNFKENLIPFNSKDFLAQLVPYEYNYKSYPKTTAGIIAQDLEKTKYGDMLVETRADGKYINYVQALSVMMACLVDINTRLSKLGV